MDHFQPMNLNVKNIVRTKDIQVVTVLNHRNGQNVYAIGNHILLIYHILLIK